MGESVNQHLAEITPGVLIAIEVIKQTAEIWKDVDIDNVN